MFVESLRHNVIENAGVELSVLRLDLLHPIAGGNKVFKLKYNLLRAKEEGKESLLTFGGAYSNHIAATALAGKENGFKTIGIIRGERINPLNKTLRFAEEYGMHLEFVSREDYRNKATEDFLNKLQQQHHDALIIPEGGNNLEGFKGAMEILSDVKTDFDVVCCAVGTGTTLAGITASLKPHQQAMGIAVLRGKEMLERNIGSFLNSNANSKINCDYSFGGYAKTSIELNDFVNNFTLKTNIQIEPIYTGKMFYAVFDLLEKGYFKAGNKILCIHTGGLQYLDA
jgi:1-aminocyclopropane-1-carboxylate deaminase